MSDAKPMIEPMIDRRGFIVAAGAAAAVAYLPAAR